MEQSGNTITACYLLNFIENRFACVWDGDIAASKHEHCLEVRVSRSLLEYGVEESFQIKNTGRRHIAIDEIGWYTSFRDTYTTGDNALQTHMNQHIWMGGDLSYIEAERQSGEGPHMGMITLDGNFTSYQLEEVNTSNHRGMGLAILPGRLKKEMTDLKTALLNGENLRENDELAKHADWADEFMKRHPEFNAENAEDIIKFEIGQVFAQVLECAGVYKCTAEGRTALKRFLTEVQNG